MAYHEDEAERVVGERCAAVVVKAGAVLLIKRMKNGQEYYVLQGGHPRINEDPAVAAIRETQEETGVIVTDPRLILEFPDGYNQRHRCYICLWVSGDKPELQGEERMRAAPDNRYQPDWFPLADVPQLTIVPLLVKQWLLDNYVFPNRRN